MKRIYAVIGAVGMFFGMVGSASAISWNGHNYQLVATTSGISWGDARSLAQGLGSGWDLVSITSLEENNFIKSNLLPTTPSDRTEYWIGGKFNGSSYEWVSEEDWVYANWWSGEPNNVNGVEAGVALDFRTGTWGNMSNTWAWNDEGSAPRQIIGYVAENSQPVPEPGTMMLLGSGLLGLIGTIRRKK